MSDKKEKKMDFGGPGWAVLAMCLFMLAVIFMAIALDKYTDRIIRLEVMHKLRDKPASLDIKIPNHPATDIIKSSGILPSVDGVTINTDTTFVLTREYSIEFPANEDVINIYLSRSVPKDDPVFSKMLKDLESVPGVVSLSCGKYDIFVTKAKMHTRQQVATGLDAVLSAYFDRPSYMIYAPSDTEDCVVQIWSRVPISALVGQISVNITCIDGVASLSQGTVSGGSAAPGRVFPDYTYKMIISKKISVSWSEITPKIKDLVDTYLLYWDIFKDNK